METVISKTETPAVSPETGPRAMPGVQALHEQLAPARQVSPTGPTPSLDLHGLKIHFLLDW